MGFYTSYFEFTGTPFFKITFHYDPSLCEERGTVEAILYTATLETRWFFYFKRKGIRAKINEMT